MTEFKKSISYAAGFYGSNFESFINFAGEHSLDGVQFIPDQYPNLYSDINEERGRDLRYQLESCSLKPSVHNVFYDINICSLVPEVQEFSLRVTEKIARLAGQLGANLVTVHPGYMYPGWRNDLGQNERFWASAGQAIHNLDLLGAKYGVTFLLENGSYCLSSRLSERRQDFHLGIDIFELDRLLSFGGSNLAICMDYGKLLVSGIDPTVFAERFLDKIYQVQVSSDQQYRESQALLGASSHSEIDIVFEGKDQEERAAFLSG